MQTPIRKNVVFSHLFMFHQNYANSALIFILLQFVFCWLGFCYFSSKNKNHICAAFHFSPWKIVRNWNTLINSISVPDNLHQCSNLQPIKPSGNSVSLEQLVLRERPKRRSRLLGGQALPAQENSFTEDGKPVLEYCVGSAPIVVHLQQLSDVDNLFSGKIILYFKNRIAVHFDTHVYIFQPGLWIITKTFTNPQHNI